MSGRRIGDCVKVLVCLSQYLPAITKFQVPAFLARWRVGPILVLVFAATRSETALRSVFFTNSIGKQNAEIINIEVEIEKSKNELFEMS